MLLENNSILNELNYKQGSSIQKFLESDKFKDSLTTTYEGSFQSFNIIALGTNEDGETLIVGTVAHNTKDTKTNYILTVCKSGIYVGIESFNDSPFLLILSLYQSCENITLVKNIQEKIKNIIS